MQSMSLSLGSSLSRVDLGGRPPRPPTDPDLPVEEASGSSSHDFATLLAKPWTTRAGKIVPLLQAKELGPR